MKGNYEIDLANILQLSESEKQDLAKTALFLYKMKGRPLYAGNAIDGLPSFTNHMSFEPSKHPEKHVYDNTGYKEVGNLYIWDNVPLSPGGKPSSGASSSNIFSLLKQPKQHIPHKVEVWVNKDENDAKIIIKQHRHDKILKEDITNLGDFSNYVGDKVDVLSKLAKEPEKLVQYEAKVDKKVNIGRSDIAFYIVDDNNDSYGLWRHQQYRLGTNLSALSTSVDARVMLAMLVSAATKLRDKYHAQGLIHADIKPENLTGDPNEKAGYIIDNEFVIELKAGEETSQQGEIKGTPFHIAPELLNDCVYTRAVDMYAFAMSIIYCLDTNYWDNNDDKIKGKDYQLLNNIYKDRKKNPPHEKCDLSALNLNSNVEKDLRELLKKMLDEVPEQRPDMSEVVDTLERVSHNMELSQWLVRKGQLDARIVPHKNLREEAALNPDHASQLLTINEKLKNTSGDSKVILKQLDELNTELGGSQSFMIDLTKQLDAILKNILQVEQVVQRQKQINTFHWKIIGKARLCERALESQEVTGKLAKINTELNITDSHPAIITFISEQLTKLNQDLSSLPLQLATLERRLDDILVTVRSISEQLVASNERLTSINALCPEITQHTRLCEEASKSESLTEKLVRINGDLETEKTNNSRYDSIKFELYHLSNQLPVLPEKSMSEEINLDKELQDIITKTVVDHRWSTYVAEIKSNKSLKTALGELTNQELEQAFEQLDYIDTLLKGASREDLVLGLKSELSNFDNTQDSAVNFLKAVVPKALQFCFENYENNRKKQDEYTGYGSIFLKLGGTFGLFEKYSKTAKVKASSKIKGKLESLSNEVDKSFNIHALFEKSPTLRKSADQGTLGELKGVAEKVINEAPKMRG